ncbi:hypothetical protein D9M69_325900 [compost metagenome]
MGDLRDGGIGDVADAILDGVEDRQQGTGGVLLAFQHALNQGQVKHLIGHTAYLGITNEAAACWQLSGVLGCGEPATSRARGFSGHHPCTPARCLDAPWPGAS